MNHLKSTHSTQIRVSKESHLRILIPNPSFILLAKGKEELLFLFSYATFTFNFRICLNDAKEVRIQISNNSITKKQ